MSKKQFTSGLDSVFSAEAQYEPNIDDSPWLLDTTAGEEAEPKRRGISRKSGKNFTSDLESLFATTVSTERPRDTVARSEELNQRTRNRPRRRVSVLSGLDALIRDTTNGKAQEREAVAAAQETSVRKRVTFTYDRDRFKRLKAIARTEGEYLKDIISSLLNEYINNYESEQGSLPL